LSRVIAIRTTSSTAKRSMLPKAKRVKRS
jgi:hypothetical protein